MTVLSIEKDKNERVSGTATIRTGGIAGDQLRTIIERVDRLEEEKRNLAEDIKEVFTEAKGNGFCVKTIRTILKRRKIQRSELEEREALLETYLYALGELPLFHSTKEDDED